MLVKCLKVLLDEEKCKKFELLFNDEINKLKDKLVTIDINDVLAIMGYDV